MNTIFFLIFPDVYVFFFFLMYSINFFSPFWLPQEGGCPSPGACWAYPRTGLVYIEQYILSIKENIMGQDSNGMFNYRIKFKFN